MWTTPRSRASDTWIRTTSSLNRLGDPLWDGYPLPSVPSLLSALDGHIMLSNSLVMFPFLSAPCMVSALWIIYDVEANRTFVPLLAFESSAHLTILPLPPTSFLLYQQSSPSSPFISNHQSNHLRSATFPF